MSHAGIGERPRSTLRVYPAPLPVRRGEDGLALAHPGQAAGGLVDDLGALAEREAHQRASGLRIVVEDARGDRHDARALDELMAEGGAVAPAVDVREVRPSRPQDLQPGGLEAPA